MNANRLPQTQPTDLLTVQGHCPRCGAPIYAKVTVQAANERGTVAIFV